MVGENFALGKNRSGTLDVIQRLCAERGIQQGYSRLSAWMGNQSHLHASVPPQKGDVEQAARLLGRLYFVRSQVIEGKRLGSKLGFPTANQLALERIAPEVWCLCHLCALEWQTLSRCNQCGCAPHL